MLTKFDLLLPAIQRALNGLTEEAHYLLLLYTKKQWQQITLKTWGSGEDTADLNWPNWYLIPYGIMLSNKSWRTTRDGGDLQLLQLFLQTHMTFPQALLPTGSNWTPVCQREVMSKLCVLLWFAWVFYLQIYLNLDNSVFLPPFHFLPVLWERGLSKQSGGCVAAGQGQSSQGTI